MKPGMKQKIDLTIQKLGFKGEGIGYWNGYAIFVDDVLPGEVIEAQITERAKNYGRASLQNIIMESPLRVKPICPLFGSCGGCQLMHLDYSKQLEFKQQQVFRAFERLPVSIVNEAIIAPCLPSPSPLAYRNKIQLPISKDENGQMLIGLYARSSHDIVNIEKCYVHCELGEDVFQHVQTILKQSNLQSYDPISGLGELKYLLIKTAINTQQVLVVLVTSDVDTSQLTSVAKTIMDRCPSVKGVIQNVNGINNNVVLGNQFRLLAGNDAVEEKICGLTFKVSPASFFQVNPAQAECLYTKAIELADFNGEENVLDAYCGVGTLSLLIAQKAKHVIGVECVSEAIEDAKQNAIANRMANTSFVCANAEFFILNVENIDVVFLNPPRKGCDITFLAGLTKLNPKTIIYISCDPGTLARDVSYLQQNGYELNLIQPFDMFPQTAHVECVVRLIKVN